MQDCPKPTKLYRPSYRPRSNSYPEFAIWTSSSRIICFSCPGRTEFATRADPSEVSGVPTARLCRLTSPACRHANDFSDTAPPLLLQLQILQPQSECYPLGTGRAEIR